MPDRVLHFVPNGKQKRFFLAKERYIAYGGARGGGKSWAVRVKALLLALEYPGIRLLIIRRTLPELEENHIRPLRAMIGEEAEYRDKDKSFRFRNGSLLRFGYCDAESDVLRYQGQEYDCIFLDEATQLTEYQFQTFKGCLRGVNRNPKRLYITCNPGGVGHGWVKRLFIERRFQSGENPEDYAFIPADVYDNEALMATDREYVQRLESLPWNLRQAWLHGSWDVFEGQFFTEWDRSVHVCEPFEVPGHWRRYVTMDYGMDMLAAYVIALDESGNAWVIREVYEGRDLGEGHTGLIISQAVEALRTLAGEDSIYEYLAPPDLWNSRQETGKSVADIFAESGIYLTKSGNDRIAGWMALRERLKLTVDEEGNRSAGLRIFSTCANLIRTLPLLRYDPKKGGDCASEPHEYTHGPDALRGFCVYYVSTGNTQEKQERPKKLIERMGQKRVVRRI